MKKDLLVVLLVSILAFLVYHSSFFNFFAQDDFILINQFSQNSLIVDFANVFGKPEVTHWRPLHNMFFLIAGNIFGTKYIFYHVFIFIIHVGAGFLIFKISNLIYKKFGIGLISALVYVLHPAHFVSLYWISGSATTIGIFLFLLSFYFYLCKKHVQTLIFWTASLLASEAMIVGLGIFLSFSFLFEKKKIDIRFLKSIFAISIFFAIIKFLLTPQNTYQIYKIELTKNTIIAIKYYILRVAGFTGVSHDLLISLILAIWLIIVLILVLKMI